MLTVQLDCKFIFKDEVPNYFVADGNQAPCQTEMRRHDIYKFTKYILSRQNRFVYEASLSSHDAECGYNVIILVSVLG